MRQMRDADDLVEGEHHPLGHRLCRVGDPADARSANRSRKPSTDAIAAARISASAVGKYRYTVCRMIPSESATSAMLIA